LQQIKQEKAMNELLAFICELMFYLGLAGVLGVIMQFTSQSSRLLRLSFLACVLLPFSLGLPWGILFKILVWVLAAIVAGVVYLQPVNEMARNWMQKFGMVYFGILMAFILAGSLLSRQTPLVWLSLPAGLAGLICFSRLFQTRTI
jgi:hypothetical protein